VLFSERQQRESRNCEDYGQQEENEGQCWVAIDRVKGLLAGAGREDCFHRDREG